MKRAYIIVKGDVQGVFFRSTARRVASDLNLKGYVKNSPDGNVEIVAEGNEEAINKLIEFCKVGPSGANVEDINIKLEVPKNEFDDFEIRY